MTIVRIRTTLNERDETTEDLTITIDPTIGNNPVFRLYGQSEIDNFGPIDTIGHALRVVPTNLFHPVTLELESSSLFPERTVHSITQDDIYELKRFVFHNVNMSGTYKTGAGIIIIKSLLSYTWDTGSEAIEVLSATSETIIQNASYSPALPDNQYKRFWLHQFTGSGENQLLAVRAHTGLNWSVAFGSPVPDPGDRFQVVQPTAILNLRDSSGVMNFDIQSNSKHIFQDHYGVVFDAVEIHTDGALGGSPMYVEFTSGGFLLHGGTIIRNARLIAGHDALLGIGTCIIDGYGASYGGLGLVNGVFRSRWSTDRTLIANVGGTDPLVVVSSRGGTEPYLFKTALDDGYGSAVVVDHRGLLTVDESTLRVSNVSGHAFEIKNGGVLEFDSGFVGTGPTGTTGEILLDGEDVLYTDVDTDGLVEGSHGAVVKKHL